MNDHEWLAVKGDLTEVLVILFGAVSSNTSSVNFPSHLKPLNKGRVMEKTVSVEAAEEGPRVKPKRQLTDAQLAALKKGRERLAAKRQAAAAAEEVPSKAAIAAAAAASEPAAEQEPEVREATPTEAEVETDDDEVYGSSGLCSLM